MGEWPVSLTVGVLAGVVIGLTLDLVLTLTLRASNWATETTMRVLEATAARRLPSQLKVRTAEWRASLARGYLGLGVFLLGLIATVVVSLITLPRLAGIQPQIPVVAGAAIAAGTLGEGLYRLARRRIVRASTPVALAPADYE